MSIHHHNNILTNLLVQSNQKFLVLDGGMGSLLESEFHVTFNTKLWSAILNNQQQLPIVQHAHIIWLCSNADIIITNTYQAPIDTELFMNGIVAANQARIQYYNQFNTNQSNYNKLIAVSCGPYAALLADGSEYTGYQQTDTINHELFLYHQQKVQYVSQYKYNDTIIGYDMIAFETIPSYIELQQIIELMCLYPHIPYYITLSCQSDVLLNDGTELNIILNKYIEYYTLGKLINCIGIGYNCTPPQYIESLIKQTYTTLQQYNLHNTLHIIVYPNAGQIWNAVTKTWSTTSSSDNIDQWCNWVKQWYTAGAHVIGGCCQTTPLHIKSTAALSSNK